MSASFDATSLLKIVSDQKSRLEGKVEKQVERQKSKILERVMNRSFNKSFRSEEGEGQAEKERKGWDSYILEKKGEGEKGKIRKEGNGVGNILDVFNKIEVLELPQRRKNIRAPMF